ncbi:MAG: DUF512 domain-containing protein [Clostridiales bacterium]|nr:DUF512 domain-containing protein [Clostridiales bacterium]
MSAVIKSIAKGSPCDGRRIAPGDRLVKINGHRIRDVLDYKYYSAEACLLLELHTAEQAIRLVRIYKREEEDLGLEFTSYLMDAPRACVNRCIFCFVDQLPRGMRKTLYFKDDDVRLSFLQGNYVTLTNLTERDIRRIIAMRISPLNVSVHSTDPALRSFMLGVGHIGAGLDALRRFQDAGIRMNCQIVCCPGVNDGAHLQRTMEDLAAMHPSVMSVSVVPVGLTKHREGLFPLEPFRAENALETVRQVERFARLCKVRLGTNFVFPADEFYVKAGLPIPPDAFYEDYPQLENGVGLLRLLKTQFDAALPEISQASDKPFSIATGLAALEWIKGLAGEAKGKFPQINVSVFGIVNDFFGDTVDVAGLITGRDLISQLRGKDLGERLLIARNMLRHGETVFLDDTTVEDVEKALGVPVRVVEQDGADLARALCGN